jgi:peptidoglycan/LPS O-acetylase OafA/YrhL
MRIIRVLLENWHILTHKTMKNYNQKVTASLEVNKPKNHLFVLDGVRAVACLGVLSYHANFLARNYGIWNPLKSNLWNPLKDTNAALIYFGESGVILFFLLSGFLLFLPFAKVLLFDGKWPSVKRFYLRRTFRIIPGYFVALFLIILFFHPEFFHAVHRSQLFELLTFRMSNDLSQQVNGPFWTLAIEFQFYMLLPILAWLFSMIVRRGTLSWRVTKLTGCLLVMFAWGLLSRYWGSSIIDTPAQISLQQLFLILKPYVYGDTGKYFEVFAVGMWIAIIYVYTQHAPNREVWLKRFQRWSVWMFLAGLLILVFLSLLHLYYINIDPYDYHKYDPVFSFLDPYTRLFSQIWVQWRSVGYSICYGLCMYALLYGSGYLKWSFEWPVLRWIGLISFSLYMWHLPFIFLYVNVILPQFQGWGGMIKYIGLIAWIVFLIIPVSLTLYRWIEMPGMRLGEALIQRSEKLKKASPVDVPGDTPPESLATDSLVEVPS